MATILAIAALVGMWFVFVKMGRQGWEGIVPFYNLYVLFEELYGNGIKFLLLLIPFYNIYIAIKLYIDWGKTFSKETGFIIGLILLNPIFMLIMAFDDSTYTKPVI